MKPFDDSIMSAKAPAPEDRGRVVVPFPAGNIRAEYARHVGTLFKEIETLKLTINSINTEKVFFQERLVQMAAELRQSQQERADLRQELHKVKDEVEARLFRAAWGLFVAWLKRLIPWGK